MISKETGHTQIPFTTSLGKRVTVDAGLWTMMENLKKMGVETKYSCEGDDFGGYFLADLWTGLRFLRRLLFKRGLSQAARLQRHRLLHKGVWEFQVSWYAGRSRGQYRIFNTKTTFGRRIRQRYALEFSASNHYKLRLTVRWPSRTTSEMSQLVRELAK